MQLHLKSLGSNTIEVNLKTGNLDEEGSSIKTEAAETEAICGNELPHGAVRLVQADP